MSDESQAGKELRLMAQHRKKAAANALFEYLFLIRHRRLPAYWEARIGEAVMNGELEVKQPPTHVLLRQIHEVAAETMDALIDSTQVAGSA
jgi:hypothetical protein